MPASSAAAAILAVELLTLLEGPIVSPGEPPPRESRPAASPIEAAAPEPWFVVRGGPSEEAGAGAASVRVLAQ